MSVFECERVGFHWLAALLTGDSEIAKRCVALAFRECMVSDSVSKGWVLRWARRTVIRNAIRLLTGGQSLPSTCAESDNGSPAFALEAPSLPKSPSGSSICQSVTGWRTSYASSSVIPLRIVPCY